MDLIDRYLYAVRRWLPANQQDDVIRELSDDLRSQIEDREAELGRTLDQGEQSALLRQWGHPLMLASRYLPQRQLIGPSIFPIYWLVLRISLGVALLVHVIAAVVMLVGGRPLSHAVNALVAFQFEPLLMVFASVTIVFAVIDRYLPNLPPVAEWDPGSLPLIPPGSRLSSMTALVAEIVVLTLFTIWVAAIPEHQQLLFGPGSAMMEIGPAALRFHLPLLLLMLANLVVLWALLLRQDWSAWRPAIRVVSNVCTLAIVVGLLTAAGDLVVPAGAPDRAAAERVARLMNSILRVALGITIVVILIELGRDVLRLVNRPQRGHAHGARL
jgi:hypothetical protein